MNIHEQFIVDLERLANQCKKSVDYIVDQAIKQEKETQVTVALILQALRIFMRQAQTLSNVKNTALGFKGSSDVDMNLEINKESVEDRITKYVEDLVENVKTFKENDNPLLVGLGLGLLSNPLFKAIEVDRHRKLVSEGVRGAASSAAFISNLDRNIFGNIFYVGRLADSQIWALNDLKAIAVVTRGDSKVCEQCKAMAGIYPPDYIFTGNHPRCRCTAEPITVGRFARKIPNKILEYALQNKHKFGKMMIYQLNDKYYNV